MSRYLLLVLFGLTTWALAVQPVATKIYTQGERDTLTTLIKGLNQ